MLFGGGGGVDNGLRFICSCLELCNGWGRGGFNLATNPHTHTHTHAHTHARTHTHTHLRGLGVMECEASASAIRGVDAAGAVAATVSSVIHKTAAHTAYGHYKVPHEP